MTTTTAGRRPLLVFDGDCAFCTTSVHWYEERFPGAFTAVPYQRADLAALGLTEDECHARLQWIGDVTEPRATRESGARAVGALSRTGGRTRGGAAGLFWRAAATLTVVPPFSWLAEGVYRIVAANRQRLPGGAPACRL
jgi:predicted DCC family thiol-disulfide oxidoreductase YuxK